MGKKNRKGLVVETEVTSDVRDIQKNVRRSVDDVHSENSLKTVTETDPLGLTTNSLELDNNPEGLEHDNLSPVGLENNPLGNKSISIADSTEAMPTVRDTISVLTHNLCNSSYTANLHNKTTLNGRLVHALPLGRGDNSKINPVHNLSDAFLTDDLREPYQRSPETFKVLFTSTTFSCLWQQSYEGW